MIHIVLPSDKALLMYDQCTTNNCYGAHLTHTMVSRFHTLNKDNNPHRWSSLLFTTVRENHQYKQTEIVDVDPTRGFSSILKVMS